MHSNRDQFCFIFFCRLRGYVCKLLISFWFWFEFQFGLQIAVLLFGLILQAKTNSNIQWFIFNMIFFPCSDTQTILTIQNHVITKNHRISILHSEHKTWQLKIKDIRESDRGFYMCQMNTDPMKSITGYLDVVGENFKSNQFNTMRTIYKCYINVCHMAKRKRKKNGTEWQINVPTTQSLNELWHQYWVLYLESINTS